MSPPAARICFISDAPHFGGAERYVVDMCAAARRRGIEAHVHWIDAAVRSTAHLFEPARAVGATLSRTSRPGFSGLTHLLNSQAPSAVFINASGRPGFWKTAWACRQLDVASAWIHHMIDPVDPRAVAARGRRHLHGLGAWRWAQTIRHRLAAFGASVVVASNSQDAAYIARWGLSPRSKLRVIAPGIDPSRWTLTTNESSGAAPSELNPHRAKPFVVGTAARLVIGKGIENLIDAAALCRKAGVEIRLLIAGTGPAERDFREQAARLGLEQSVQFRGFIENMAGFYHQLDAFALCSATESFGLTLTEAMACGRAVLATPTHGAMRQISHGVNGLLAAGFGAPHIASALLELARDQSLRTRLSQRAHADAHTRFTIDRTLDQVLENLHLRRAPARLTSHPVCTQASVEVPA